LFCFLLNKRVQQLSTSVDKAIRKMNGEDSFIKMYSTAEKEAAQQEIIFMHRRTANEATR